MKNIYLKRRLLAFYVRIVREKASPEYIARGWAIGMFFGCLIPFGFQLMCSIPTAFLLKGSKLGATLGTFITNHFSIFIIYPVQCYAGSLLMGRVRSLEEIKEVMTKVISEQSYEALFSIGTELVAAFFIGGAVFAGIMTPPTYFLVKTLVIKYRQKKSSKRTK